MILDASAVVAVVLREPGHEELVRKISGEATLGIGAPTMVEAGIVLAARRGPAALAALDRLVHEAGVAVVPFGDEHQSVALDAWARYGKGRHAAALNFGDCLAYATAKVAGRPLLCVGGDFARTDLPLA